MRKITILFIALLSLGNTIAQELNCEVIINAEQTGKANLSVFKTLERSLKEFINRTTWTNQNFKNQERISCSMFITITSFEGENFNGSIQVQSSRPVYGSSMISPVLNFNDEQLSFAYREYQPLNYSENTFNSNLISVVSFYVYTILGLDADTFELEGGTEYFEEANRVVTTAQQGNAQGWQGADGPRSRFRLNTDLLANTYTEYRTALYEYHRLGLDNMHTDIVTGKTAIADALEKLEIMNRRRSNSLLLRSFFDSKAEEVTQIFSDGPSIGRPQLVETLNNIAPRYSKNWRNLQ